MYANYDDVLRQMQDFGLVFDASRDLPLAVGTLRPKRVKVDGARERKGWYQLHELRLDSGDLVLVGAFGAWHGLENNSQKIKIKGQPLTAEQKKALKDRMESDRRRAKAARERELKIAQIRADKMWRKMAEGRECEYLKRKQAQHHGTRSTPDGTLAVPMMDMAGQVHGIQFIGPRVRKKLKETDKQYWPPGMSTTARFCPIGTPKDGELLLVCEGYATGSSLHQATGHAVFVAFDAGNLLNVAPLVRQRYPTARILVCADDDFATPGNTGLTAATNAALAVGGRVVIPQFVDDPFRADLKAANLDPTAKDYKQQIETLRAGRPKLTDFNDLHVSTTTLQSVRDQVEAAAVQFGPVLPQRPREVVKTGGGGARIAPITSSQELFERFAVIYGHNKSVFDFQERMLLSVEDMKLACSGREIWRTWLESTDKKMVRIENVGFDPDGTDPRITCNLWGGWPIEPKQGKCDELLGLLQYLCANEKKNERDLYQWILKWLAYPLQNPGAKMKTAILVHGPQRVGKNFFFETYMRIYGEYGQVIDQDALEDKYNDCFSRKLFLIADEVIARQELYHVKNKLKGMITGSRIRINPKNVKSYWETNHCNLIFLSNETQPLILDRDDGRHAVLWTPPKLSLDYYKRVEQEVEEGGVAALYWHLLHEVDLTGFNEYTPPPETIAKNDLMELSMDSTERFCVEWDNQRIEGVPKIPAKSMQLYSAYRGWCLRNGFTRYIAPEPKFLAEVTKRTLAVKRQAHYLIGAEQKVASFVFPDGIEQPPDMTQQLWLSDCVNKFDFALNEMKEGQM